jgi:hypothetical protein
MMRLSNTTYSAVDFYKPGPLFLVFKFKIFKKRIGHTGGNITVPVKRVRKNYQRVSIKFCTTTDAL